VMYREGLAWVEWCHQNGLLCDLVPMRCTTILGGGVRTNYLDHRLFHALELSLPQAPGLFVVAHGGLERSTARFGRSKLRSPFLRCAMSRPLGVDRKE